MRSKKTDTYNTVLDIIDFVREVLRTEHLSYRDLNILIELTNIIRSEVHRRLRSKIEHLSKGERL